MRLIVCGGEYEVPLTLSTFSGGEEHVKLGKLPVGDSLGYVTIKADLRNSSDVMRLVLLKDAVEQTGKTYETFSLDLGYLPYARQDRVCSPGEAFSLRAFARIINSLNFHWVFADDVHSSVALYEIERLVNRPKSDFMLEHLKKLCDAIDVVLVSPDAGASGNVFDLQSKLNMPELEVICCTKERDPVTGTPKPMEMQGIEKAKDKVAIIIDDIVDGGRTFTPLSRSLKEAGAEDVYLVVTHAILPYGTDALLEAGVDAVFCKNNLSNIEYPWVSKLFPIEDLFSFWMF